MAAESEASQANAAKAMLDTIIAPKDAFTAIRAVPTWGLALAVAIVLSAIGAYLMIPAFQHGAAGTFAHMAASDPRIGAMSPDDQQRVLAMQQKGFGFAWIFVLVGVPFGCGISALVMLIFDKIGRGEGVFAKYWAAACNIAVVAGIGSLITGIIAAARGAASFPTVESVQQALPTLALVAPGAGVKVVGFLAAITPFSLWSAALVFVAISTIGRTSRVPAWLGAATLLLVPALIAAAFAK